MEGYAQDNFNKNAIPVRWGIIISIVSILIFTIVSMFLMESLGVMASTITGIVSFIIVMVMLGMMATQQKKAMGGYITFRQAFQAIFLSILIIVVISQVYTFIYLKWIDPTYTERMMEMAANMTSNLTGSEEAADQVRAQTEAEAAKQFTFSRQAMGFAMSLIVYSLFGFVVAAIVKRNKPEHLA